MTQSIDYQTIAAEYARHRRVNPAVLRRLAEAAGDRVLEVGCGPGNYSLALAAPTGWGVDPAASMLARRPEPGSDGQGWLVGRAENLPLAPAFFDLVFSVDVIHHLEEPGRYFRQAYRVLRAGGQLCTVTDSAEIIRGRQPLSTYFPETVALELARYPRLAALREWMAGAGFGQIREEQAAFPYQLVDIQPYRDKAFSALHLLDEAAFRQGIARLEQALQAGPVAALSRYVLLWGVK